MGLFGSERGTSGLKPEELTRDAARETLKKIGVGKEGEEYMTAQEGRVEAWRRDTDEARVNMDALAEALDELDPDWRSGEDSFNRPSGQEMPAEAKGLYRKYLEQSDAFDKGMSGLAQATENAEDAAKRLAQHSEGLVDREVLRQGARDANMRAGRDPDAF